MPTTMPTAAADRVTFRTAWGRFLNAVMPAPDADRLVRVTEVSRGALPLVEGSLADVSISAVLREIPAMTGESRFVILVPAGQAATAAAALEGI
jgi:hypothetical protein